MNPESFLLQHGFRIITDNEFTDCLKVDFSNKTITSYFSHKSKFSYNMTLSKVIGYLTLNKKVDKEMFFTPNRDFNGDEKDICLFAREFYFKGFEHAKTNNRNS